MSSNSTLEVQKKELNPCHWEVSVTVPAARVVEEHNHAYQSAARGMKIPGFRPGKAPISLLRATLGDTVLEDAKQHLFEHVMGDAIREVELQVLRVKDFDSSKIEVSEESDLAFVFQVETTPNIQLPSWDDIQVSSEDTTPTEEQVDEAVASVAQRQTQFDETDKGTTLKEEYVMNCDLVYMMEDQKGPDAQDVKLSLDSPLYGVEEDAWKEAVEGVCAGTEKRIPVTFNDGFSEADWVGKSGEAVLQVKSILTPRPATEDELAEHVSMKPEEFRERLTQQVIHENNQREMARVVEAMFAKILDQRPFELAPSMVQEEADNSFESQIQRTIRESGMPEEKIRKEMEQHRDEIADVSHRRLKIFFLIREIARQEKLRVTGKDMDQAYRALGARHGLDSKAIKKLYKEQQREDDLASDVLEGKVREYLHKTHLEQSAVEADSAEA